MALDNDSIGEQLHAAYAPSGTSGSPALLAQQKRVAAALTQKLGIALAAEALDVIPALLTLSNGNDEAVAEIADYEAFLIDANGIECLAAAFTLSDGGDGTLVTNDAQARLIGKTAADGTAQLDITDVAGASGATIYLVVRPFNVLGAATYTAVTFD